MGTKILFNVRRFCRGALIAFLLGATIIGIEILQAMRHPFAAASSAPPSSGIVGVPHTKPFRLTLIGDSTAASVGTDRAEDTLAARLADSLHERWVYWNSYGVPGARVEDIFPQVRHVLREREPDAVVVLIGANDVLHLTPLTIVKHNLYAVVRTLRSRGIPVIVGTCPEMGTPAFLPPLRTIISMRGYQVAAAEKDAVRAAGGVSVDLAAEVGPLFFADPRTLSWDAFHPSARGYALWAQALSPALRAASISQPPPPIRRLL
jgi:lysophospholipase L1-like esterase